MNEAGNPVKLVTHYPPPMLLPKQPAAPIATITPRRVDEPRDVDFEKKEVVQLRCDNLRLMEELDRARMHPMFDDSCDRINISHELWLKQQKDLRRMQEYKTRYYVVVFILILITIRYCMHFVIHF